MRCPRCGAENSTGLPFCKQCWTSLPVEAPTDPNAAESRPQDPQGPASGPPSRGPLFGVPYESDPSQPHDMSWTQGAHYPIRFDPPRSAPITPPYAAPHPWQRPVPGPSTRSVLVCMLGALSAVLFCLTILTLPIDIAAIALGVIEIRSIASGRASPAGRAPALIGICLAGLALLVKTVVLLSAVFHH